MKLALSTLGCPELSVPAAARLAKAQGYSGLELRSAPGATVSAIASKDQRLQWRRDLDGLGVEALAVASYLRVCDMKVDDQGAIEAGAEQLRLARDLGARWLRVFPGGVRGVPCTPEVEERAGRRLATLAAVAGELGVGLAVETHDSHPSARDVVRLLDAAGDAETSVVWDVLHTWLDGEEPDETVRVLGDRVAYVQVKDVATRGDLAPLPLGHGVLPLGRCLDLVQAHDLTTWVSWEYERVWHPDAAPLDEVGVPGRRWLMNALAPRT